MTIPLPALAEKTNPALNIVKMAKPFAFSSTVRGMTYRMPRNRQLAATRVEVTENVRHQGRCCRYQQMT